MAHSHETVAPSENTVVASIDYVSPSENTVASEDTVAPSDETVALAL